MKKPKCLAHPNNITLANQQGIQRYIEYLEKEVEVLSSMIRDLKTQTYALQQELEEVKK